MRKSKRTSLEDKVQKLLGSKVETIRASHFDKIYHQNFENSGIEKAVEVLEDLQKRHYIDLAKCAYFSIGGSIGSEIFHILNNTPMKYGILLEYNPTATEIARKRIGALHQLGKELVIVTGDAMQQLGHCTDQFLDWRDSHKIRGLVVSAQAVLHELPSRSPGFNLNHFLGEITWEWDPFIFYSREPCVPLSWPEKVEIHVPDLSSKALEALAKDVQVHLGLDGLILRSGPKWVSMPAILAIETLTKIFYLDDYAYELCEQVTSIDPNTLRAILENLLGHNSTSIVRLTSDSFRQKYRELGIQVREPPKGNRLYMPETFARIVAERIRLTRSGTA